MNKYLFPIIIAFLVTAGAVFWYWKENQRPATVDEVKTQAAQAIEELTSVPEASVPTSAIEGKVPELNPVDKTNPFKVYQNPF